MVQVTQEHVEAARVAGACKLPRVGQDASEFSQNDLAWFAEVAPDLCPAVPLVLYAGDGYGSGDGSGAGSGDGGPQH